MLQEHTATARPMEVGEVSGMEKSYGTLTEFDNLDATLPEPLPSSADVDSPDFRYERFFFDEHDPADYAPEVERERQRHADEKAKPDGVIAQRLAGDR